MLVTFQSRATPEVVMLRDLAEYLLALIGRRLEPQGVILHDELNGAIERLKDAVAEVEQTERPLENLRHSKGSNRMAANELSQRAWPLLQMMQESEKQQTDIIWGL
jgi:hypothetical protein